MKALYCNRCRARLTRQLDIVSGKDPAVTLPELKDREPPVESGVAFKSWKPLVRSFSSEPAPLEFTPQYWLNPDDLTGLVSPLHSRMNGCCGPSGHDGPNQLCRCKAEIGTYQNDCFTPRIFIPNPETTTWVGGADDFWNHPQ